MAPDAHAPGVDQPGRWFMPDRLTHSATGRPAPTKSIISKTKDLIPTIKPEDEEDLHPELNRAITEFQLHLANMEDASVFDLKDIVDEIVNAKVLDDDVKIQVIGYLKQRARHAGLDESEITGEEGIFSDVNIEDNEEPKRGITGLNPRRSPELHSMKSHAIDKIDLNKWREYPAEDVMKAVYRRYGKELPSVDSYDWAITWDKKVRPWLKEHEGTF